MARLGDYVKICTGKLDANASDENGAYPFFTCSREPLRINAYSYDCECVLVAGNGDLNVKYYSGKFDAYQRTYIIEVTDCAKLLPKYLYFFLDSYIEVLRNQSIGGVIKYIKLGHLTEVDIPLPNIEKQAQIVGVLEKYHTIYSATETQLSKLDELVKSRFIELFGDPTTNPMGHPVKALHEVAEYFNGLTYKPENVSATGTVVLRSSNIQNSELDFEDTVRVDCPIRDKLWVKENDILMCSRNGSARLVGKVALIKGLAEPMSFGAFMMIIRSPYYQYLMTFFQMDAFRQQIKTGATTTINQITGRMLDDVMLPIPDMEAVAVFSAFVEQTDKLKLAVKESMEKLEVMKKALIQKYFG